MIAQSLLNLFVGIDESNCHCNSLLSLHRTHKKISTRQPDIMASKVMHSIKKQLTILSINFAVPLSFNMGRCCQKRLQPVKIQFEKNKETNKLMNSEINTTIFTKHIGEETLTGLGTWMLNGKIYTCSSFIGIMFLKCFGLHNTHLLTKVTWLLKFPL